MSPKQLFITVPAALFVFSSGPANAGQTINDVGAIACVNDKWDEKEVEKGHKFVDYAGRCVNIPDDSAAPKYTEECVGKYEYMPDESWRPAGLVPTPIKAETLCLRAGRRVHTSRNIRTRSQGALVNSKVPVAAALISMRT